MMPKNPYLPPMNFIAIDFETANSNRSSICSLGVAIVEDGKLVETTEILIRPTPDYYDGFNTALHGISDQHTRDKGSFLEQWQRLRVYFDGMTIVAHNAAFDCSALRAVLDAAVLDYPDFDYHCTWRLAQKTLTHLPNHKLDMVSRHFNIKLKHHNAESDAQAAALIAIKLCEMHEADSLETLSTNLGFKIGKIMGVTNSYKPFSKR
jgi:DNA polymerase III subunit epsilon